MKRELDISCYNLESKPIMTCPIDIKPYAKSEEIKNKPIISLNYTNQDFWSLKKRLRDFLMERFGENGTELPNTFNDLIESSIAIMLIENWAFIGDCLSFKIDQTINEIGMDTVTEKENAFKLAEIVGFKPTPPIAARSKWIAQLNNILSTDINIPTPVIIDITSDGSPTRIELFPCDSSFNPIFDEDIIIPAGQSYNQAIIGLEGRTVEETFAGSGEVSQVVNLSFFPVIYDSLKVEVDGTTWSQVDYFTDSMPRREYRADFNSSYEGFVIFGNNAAGLIPSSGSRIRVTYRVGGGTAGNIVTGAVEEQKQISVSGLDFTVPVSYRNYSRGEYGYAGDSIEDIRIKLPQWHQAQNRAVSSSDYKTLAGQFVTPYYGQIGKAEVSLRNHGCAGNIIDIYILARDGVDGLALASNELKVALSEELDTKKMITDYVCIKDGSIIYVDVSIDITLGKFYKKFEKEINENIKKKINSFFLLNNWDFGRILRENDIIKEISDIKELETIQVSFVTESETSNIVSPKYYEVIRPDNINISFVYG